MRCHKCNQDSIDIDNGHIVCDICGLDINISLNLEEDHFFDLFFYNMNLEEAEKLGHEAMLDSKELVDNPYTVDSDQIILNKRWELGYNNERESYELAALSLSSEKIESQLRGEIRALKDNNKLLNDKIDKFIPENHKYIDDFCAYLLGKTFIGRILSKDIHSFSKEYKTFFSGSWGIWKDSE
jgi:hypothetical protein